MTHPKKHVRREGIVIFDSGALTDLTPCPGPKIIGASCGQVDPNTGDIRHQNLSPTIAWARRSVDSLASREDRSQRPIRHHGDAITRRDAA